MSYENVDITVVDTTPLASPIVGVTIRVLSEDGKLIYGQLTTDALGKASVILPVGVYQVRPYKFGVTFSASLLDVQAHPVVNNFSITGEVFVYPSSKDTRLCVASGIFRTPTGGVARGVDIHFIAKWSPIMLDGSPIMPERVLVRTDNNGYVEVSLIRFGQYDATIEGMEDYQRVVSVPDYPAVPIGDLLFPVVAAITFDEAAPHSVVVGASISLTPHVYCSDLNETPTIMTDVIWTSSDSNGLIVEQLPDSITLRGLIAGTYELRAVRKDESIVRIPNTPISGVPVTITVT
jgi:hypothetical protein